MQQAHALIVDDEPDILELLEITLSRMKIKSTPAADLHSAHAALRSRHFDLCLTDMRLPDGDGIELVRTINSEFPQLPVAVITAHGNMETAIEAMKAGAFDFVSKPVDLDDLRKLTTAALKLRIQSNSAEKDTQLLGDSKAIRHIRKLVEKLARNQAPVYISGESGTGKELVARQIHQQSPRADKPFIAVNCGAIPGDLVESELFGHLRGSFTGAHADKEGLFQAADGGTLLLDEVGDLPPQVQVKLLRAIQERAIRPVGARKELTVDVRLISATHKNLAELVQSGEFRQDLFYRINVIELPIPPLRDRPEDIPALVEHFSKRISAQCRCPQPAIHPEALAALKTYDFPGNVRELENILERAIALCDEQHIEVEDLSLPEKTTGSDDEISGLNRPLEDYLGEVEKQAILQALEETRWNRTAAAKKLGMSLRSLRYRLSKLGLA